MKLPSAKRDLAIENADSECIAYDQCTGTAHLLSPPMALVLQACRGVISEKEMLSQLSVSDGVSKEILVEKIVGELQDLLLVEGSSDCEVTIDVGRRKFIQMATLTAPLVISMMVPGPAAASSTCGVGCTVAGAPCNPGTGCVQRCFFQYTCNDLVNNPFVSCNPADSCASGDFKNPTLLCVTPNGTFSQQSCAAARANAIITVFNQGTYVCEICP